MQIVNVEETIPGPNDQPAAMTFDLTNGDQLRARRTDPYGFWFLSLKSGGEIPAEYAGAYTSKDEIQRVVPKYLDSRRLEVGPNTRPEIQYKPGYGPGGKKEK